MKSITDMINPITTPSYEDFEPYFEWNKEEGKETLKLHVQGFKREQLKVDVSSRGNLTITGQCPIDKSKWRRFTKEFKIPKDCNKTEINAIFTKSAHLYIVMPKNLNLTTKQAQELVNESKHNGGIDKVRSPKVVVKVVIATVVLAMGVYAIYKHSRSSFVNLSDM